VTPSIPWWQNVTVVFLLSTSLALLISEWRYSKASWTEGADADLLVASGIFLFFLTSLLLLAHWGLVLVLAAHVDLDEQTTGSRFRADNIDALDD
jgi:protein-S-isoprenylcysteine O-methyltransferase Ste14